MQSDESSRVAVAALIIVLRPQHFWRSPLCRQSGPDCVIHSKENINQGVGAVWRDLPGVPAWLLPDRTVDSRTRLSPKSQTCKVSKVEEMLYDNAMNLARSKAADLHSEVFVNQEIGRLKVTMHDWRGAAVKIVHASCNVQCHPQPPLFVQDQAWRPELCKNSTSYLRGYEAKGKLGIAVTVQPATSASQG